MVEQKNVTHYPSTNGLGGFIFMKSLCGNGSLSSALDSRLVTCPKCLLAMNTKGNKNDN